VIPFTFVSAELTEYAQQLNCGSLPTQEAKDNCNLLLSDKIDRIDLVCGKPNVDPAAATPAVATPAVADPTALLPPLLLPSSSPPPPFHV